MLAFEVDLDVNFDRWSQSQQWPLKLKSKSILIFEVEFRDNLDILGRSQSQFWPLNLILKLDEFMYFCDLYIRIKIVGILGINFLFLILSFIKISSKYSRHDFQKKIATCGIFEDFLSDQSARESCKSCFQINPLPHLKRSNLHVVDLLPSSNRLHDVKPQRLFANNFLIMRPHRHEYFYRAALIFIITIYHRLFINQVIVSQDWKCKGVIRWRWMCTLTWPDDGKH